MSSPVSSNPVPVRQSHHILIIDDSARLRFALADLIVAACLATGKPYRVFHADKDGQFTQSHESLNPASLSAPAAPGRLDPARLDEFAVYTAPSPKQALFVINSPLFTRLTIICDVIMPADTEVGLPGMLDAISQRNLSVNLVFASSDAQNRLVVARLVEAGKAYFVVKAAGVWENLSHSLVNRTESFQYKKITPLDFAGIGGASTYATRSAGLAAFGDEVSTGPRSNPPVAANPALPIRPVSPNAHSNPATFPMAPEPAPPPKSRRANWWPFAALLRVFRGR